MLDREQDKAINESRRQFSEAPLRIPGYDTDDPQNKEDYVAGIVAPVAPELYGQLKARKDLHYNEDGTIHGSIIQGKVLTWAADKRGSIDHLDEVQEVLFNRIRQLDARALGLPDPTIEPMA